MAIFANHIQSEYYGVNRSILIEGIILHQFSDTQLPIPLLEPVNLSCHALFHSFF